MDRIHVEKVGGLGGFGGTGGKLRSIGELEVSRLSEHDRNAIEALFGNRDPQSARKDEMRDEFRYRITRVTTAGAQTIEVPERHVPEAVRACVIDRLE